MFDIYLKRVQIGDRKGVVTTVTIPSNVPICEIKGDIITFDSLSKLENPNDALQIGPDIYIAPSGSITDYIRHSCNPNCMLHVVGNRAIIYSMYVIKADSEITYDYSSTSTESLNTWEMKCTCKSFNCRKNISGFQYLDPQIQLEYKRKGIAALFIREPIFLKK